MPGPSNEVLKRHIDWGMVAVVVTLLVQTAGVVWWASTIDARVSRLEQDIKPLTDTSETVARLDERTASINDATDRIERRLERLEDGK